MRLPLEVSLEPTEVELEVSFVAEDDEPSASSSIRGRAARQVAASLGASILGSAGNVHLLGGQPLQAVVGIGRRADVTADTLRRAAGHAVVCATQLRRESLSIQLRPGLPSRVAPMVALEAIGEGVLLAAHAQLPRATLTPKADSRKPPTRCVVRTTHTDSSRALERARDRACAVALARELGDTPANRLSPVQLAEAAAEAGRNAGLSTEVLDAEALERLEAGLILAVGAGSTRPPAFGVLRYTPPGAQHHVAVVGKGITFDAGGISIKPSKGMGDMVHDKAGAAAVAAIAVGAAHLGLPLAVTAILACAENLPSGGAYRPGDVLRGMDGSTVEVIDTDAEGRLVLADALTYAVRLDQPRPVDVVIDLATLTGSIVSALGNEAAGLFGNTEPLAQRMLEAAGAAGEPLWRMPILAGHRAMLKSERADRKQCSPERWGDCAIAAAFLEAYVDQRPWLHLDIAGVAYNEGSPEWPAYHPQSGAAGAGVSTVLRFLEALG
jgi:leucyl aminopeptidase